MTIEESIILHLRLSGIVGVRVFGAVLPQGATMPALTVQRISGVGMYTHQGRVLMRSRMQVTTWASTYQSCVETGRAVRAAMDTFSHTSGPGRARLLMSMDLGRESESTLFQQIQDFELLHPDTA